MPILTEEVERHITEYGVYAFIVGMYGNFDDMAKRAVIAAKQRHVSVRLSFLLPYHPAERRIEKPKEVDELYYPDGVENTPRRYAIIKANQKVIDKVDYLIAYVSHPASNTIRFLEYANRREHKREIKITNIAQITG